MRSPTRLRTSSEAAGAWYPDGRSGIARLTILGALRRLWSKRMPLLSRVGRGVRGSGSEARRAAAPMSETSSSPPETPDPTSGDAPEADPYSDASLRADLEAALADAADAKDIARRAQADLANVRRRAQEERSRFRSLAVEQVCRRLLPILDDLGRAAGEARRVAPGESDPTAADAPALAALGDGVRLVLRRFEETLAEQGLVEIEALGQPFDPRVHEALQRLPATAEQQDGEVVAVYLRGYLLDGRVVRPAQVIVAEEFAAPESSGEEEEPDASSDEAPPA